ncbi:MAG TPA: hypothetical protein PK466_09170 [Thermotogota bacterium]|nr:hypothetical protein [Thermotogota bacterium]
MKRHRLFVMILLITPIVFSNTFFHNFKENGLHDEQIPDEATAVKIINISDAVYYSFSNGDSDPCVLKLSGINTECSASAKFCIREAANHFVHELLKDAEEELYVLREKDPSKALIWLKYEGSYYLINLLLLFYDYAFVEGASDLLVPYFERYDKIEAQGEVLKNTLGDRD